MATGAGPNSAICPASKAIATAWNPSAPSFARRARSGVKYLTLYAFSVENWNRPKDEVDTLMKYLARFLKAEIGELNRNNVRLDAIGQIYRLPEFVQEQLQKTKAALARNSGLTLILALSYGGRTEIVEAARSIAQKVKDGNWSRRRSTNKCSRSIFTPPLSRPRSADSHQRRDAHQQFSVVADFLRGTGGHAHALAGFSQAAIFRGAGGIHPAAPALRTGVAASCRNTVANRSSRRTGDVALSELRRKCGLDSAPLSVKFPVRCPHRPVLRRRRCPRALFSCGGFSASWCCGRL